MQKKRIRAIATLLCLIASYPSHGAPSFMGGWESGTVSGTGNTNWRYQEAVAPDRFTLVRDASRPGTYARVEVRSGDNPLQFCCNDTDRAEVSGMQNADGSMLNENISSGTQQIAFSVKFDRSWQQIADSGSGGWGIFLQLHGPNVFGAAPALALSATDQIRLNARVGDLDNSGLIQHDLLNGALNQGQWIDFIFTVKFAADSTGFVNLKRRDEGETTFADVLDIANTPTLQYSSSFEDGVVMDHYWKTGLYRSREDFTSVLYLDGMTRQLAAVPEPQTYALMLGGLVIIGFATRRRKKSPPSAERHPFPREV